MLDGGDYEIIMDLWCRFKLLDRDDELYKTQWGPQVRSEDTKLYDLTRFLRTNHHRVFSSSREISGL